MNITVGKKAIAEATQKLKNWGRWGTDDQIGTLNHVRPEDIVRAASLIRTGKVFALGIPLDRDGPQTGLFGGRWNPIHTMLATGTDAVAGRQDKSCPTSATPTTPSTCRCSRATHWDSLGHIFYEEKMYNGHDARARRLQRPRQARHRAHQEQDGRPRRAARHPALQRARLAAPTARRFPTTISTPARARRTSRSGAAISSSCAPARWSAACKEKNWGAYAGGDAPGVNFENCYWCQDKEIAAICTDTWGVEVRPNETSEANQPWHWVVIPAMGLTMGEMFYLKELAEDCAADRVYEFFFCGPPLVITGGTGSPINPQAIK